MTSASAIASPAASGAASTPSGGSSPSRSNAARDEARELRQRRGADVEERVALVLRLPGRGDALGEALAERLARPRGALAPERGELLGEGGEHRVEPADRLVEDPDLLLVEVGEERLVALLDDEVDLDRPRLAEPVEPADALLEHERGLGEVGADEVVGELEVPPLAARLAGQEDRGALRIPEPRHQAIARLDRGGVVVQEGLAARERDPGLQLAERLDVVAEDQDLLSVAREPRAQLDERRALLAPGDVGPAEAAGGEGADLDAAVPDEPGGEAVAIREVREQREPVRQRRGAGEEVVARGELAQELERVGDGRAGEEAAGHVRVRVVLVEPREELLLRGRRDGLHEGEEPEVLPGIQAHRGGGEEEDPERRPADRGDGGVQVVVREVVRLVHDHEVERHGRRGAGELLVRAQRLERDDCVRRLRERRLPAAELGDPLRGEQGEERVELVEQLGEPLEREVLGDDDEHALREPELAEAGEHEPGLDRLPEAHLVREDEARHAIREDPAGGADLVREDVDARREERAEGVRAAERLEAHDPRAERERRDRSRVPGRDRLDRTADGALERRLRRHLEERGIAARDDGDALAPGEPDRDAPPLVRDLHDDADAPALLGAMHDLDPWLPRHHDGRT